MTRLFVCTPTGLGTKLAVRVMLLVGMAALSACASRPPTPAWQSQTRNAMDLYLIAYLDEDARSAKVQWERVHKALQQTASVEAFAQALLLRCAAESASLATRGACPDFERWKDGSSPAQRAYADYLRGAPLDAPTLALLAPWQQRTAQRDAADPTPLDTGSDPLSLLVGAARLLRSGKANPAVLEQALQAASDQGWRRPLRAWLQVRATLALEAGDSATHQHTQRRLQLLDTPPGY